MQLKNFSKHTDYIIETKNAKKCEKTICLTIFVKKLFFFRVKKNWRHIFGRSYKKKWKITLPDESRDQIEKSQEIWDWLVHLPQSGGW